MARKKKIITTDAAPVASYKHNKDKRARIPTQEESQKLSAKDKHPVKKTYDYDPSLDPQLMWTGKKEAGADFGAATVPIYVQEKIAPEAIIARLKTHGEDPSQMLLFGQTATDQIKGAVEFYKHEDNWQNRMILGDSLLVMNSLLEKEGLRNKVQTIYLDPPYGIRFGSNWQASTKNKDVKDNKMDDLVRQPEQIKAFRDTWELGVHSYLSYMRDRLILSRELLTESGSCFVQISDENVHHLREIMDEVFGASNFVTSIAYVKTSGLSSKVIKTTFDYILWYAKDSENVKARKLFIEKNAGMEGASKYTYIELSDGTRRPATDEEMQNPKKNDPKARLFSLADTTSQGNPIQEFTLNNKVYKGGWKTTIEGMKNLAKVNRLHASKNTINYIRYIDDFPVFEITNLWEDIAGIMSRSDPKIYVVQTSTVAIQRCILMTTDPGDLVLDPTCGSGTTAYVSEQWGRRWITVDTSRVALALARTRLMTARYPYYTLKEENNIRAGFEYEKVPHVTLGSMANNEEQEFEVLYDKPNEEKTKVRVTGPFTVESLSPHRVSDAQEMVATEKYVQTVVENMLRAGVQTGEKGARVEFVNLDILPGGPEIQASGEYKTKDGTKTAGVAIGPEFGSVDDDFVRDAVRVAKKFADLLIVAGTSFEGAAFAEPAQVEGLRVMKVKINPDLSMGELLKKTGVGNLFLAFGEPEVKIKQNKDEVIVEILGVDVYDPVKGEIRSSGSGNLEHDIAVWFIDTNYSGEAFFVHHAYFLGEDKPYERLRKALNADINESAWKELYSTVSRPFPKPKTGKVAVKVINHFGDEVMKILEVK